jgi:hypothetical protein
VLGEMVRVLELGRVAMVHRLFLVQLHLLVVAVVAVD